MITIRTPEKREKILAALVECGGNSTAACKRVRVSRNAIYEWRMEDPDFSAAYDAALERGIDALEDEARRRAFSGTARPVYQGGKKVGKVQEYSDTLLIFLLKGARPEKYRERAEVKMLHSLTPEMVERLDLMALGDEDLANAKAGKVSDELIRRLTLADRAPAA